MFVIMWKNCMRAESQLYALARSDHAPAHPYVALLRIAEVNCPALVHGFTSFV